MMQFPLVICGAQWGDEGKGKVTDILAEHADYVVRYQGGNNAGHTVVTGKEVFKLHLIPSGVLQGKQCMIAGGVVLDPRVLLDEINALSRRGIKIRLMIDSHTTLIMPYHCLLDKISESVSNSQEHTIGTTQRGIGPAYEDRYGRRAILFGDLFDEKLFKKKLHEAIVLKKRIVEKVYEKEWTLDEEAIAKEYLSCARKLRQYKGDVSHAVYHALHSTPGTSGAKKVVFEGAQGTFLDIGHGTYPYVTSSHTISGGVFTNVGIPPQNLEVIGIAKAYTTRVGKGPFLTELEDATGEAIRTKGKEVGTTTGRPRRCGWLDLVMLRYAHRLNGFSSLALMKLDVLSGLDKIKVGVQYTLRGKKVDFPLTLGELEACSVVYKEFEGFSIPPGVRTYRKLEPRAKAYLEFIESYLGVPFSLISVGAEREETIFKDV